MSSNSKSVFLPEEKQSIIVLSVIFFFRMLGLFLVLPVFTAFAIQLEGATPALVGFALGVYGLTQALLQIPFGIWSDRIGRKPIIAFGLCLFIVGSIISAEATTIHSMIVGRLLQGAGAISSAIFALIADLTRDEVRTRANAVLGGSIGISFGMAIVSAPFLAEIAGLRGLFWVISIAGMISLFLLFKIPPGKKIDQKKESAWQLIKQVIHSKELLVINWGSFICSAGISVSFFMTPFILSENGWNRSELWKIYLPMLFFGAIAMFSMAILAEVKKKHREVMLLGALILSFSFIIYGIGLYQQSLIIFLIGLFLFFIGFNVFEPLFPSLITKLTSANTKGTASGLYNFSQFIGHFFGAVMAGVLFNGSSWILMGILLIMSLFFFYILLSFPKK